MRAALDAPKVTRMNPQEPERLTPTPVGTALKHQRVTADLGVREAARRAGISAGYLSDIEHGRRDPSPEVVTRVATGIAEVYR